MLLQAFWNILQNSKETTLREKCFNLEFFWSVFSRIRTEYGNLQSNSPYLVRIWENKYQKNSEFGYFSGSQNHAEFFPVRVFQGDYFCRPRICMIARKPGKYH